MTHSRKAAVRTGNEGAAQPPEARVPRSSAALEKPLLDKRIHVYSGNGEYEEWVFLETDVVAAVKNFQYDIWLALSETEDGKNYLLIKALIEKHFGKVE